MRNWQASDLLGAGLSGQGWRIERVFRLERGEADIADFIRPYWHGNAVAYLEDVHGWGEGRSFAFGRYFGFVRGCLYTAGLREENGGLVMVTPQTWMKAMGVPKQKPIGKAAHRQAMRGLADSMQPDVTATNWNAAALLIAMYALRQETGRGLLGDPVRA